MMMMLFIFIMPLLCHYNTYYFNKINPCNYLDVAMVYANANFWFKHINIFIIITRLL